METAVIRRRGRGPVRPSAVLVVLALGLALLAGWASAQPSDGDRAALGSIERAIPRVPHVAAPQSSIVLERSGSHARQLLRRSPQPLLLWALAALLVVATIDRRSIRGRSRLLGAMVQRVPLRRRGPPALS